MGRGLLSPRPCCFLRECWRGERAENSRDLQWAPSSEYGNMRRTDKISVRVWLNMYEQETKMKRTEGNLISPVEQSDTRDYGESVTGIVVKLVGENGNAFAILARVSEALRRGGRVDQIEPFLAEARSGDCLHLFQTCCRYCVCE